MTGKRPSSAAQGFTLVEMLIVLAIIGFAVILGYPALMNMIRRSQVEGAVRQAGIEFRAARLEAVKKSSTVYIEADFTNDRLVTWRETGTDEVLTPASDERLREMPLPKGVWFWGPGDPAAEGLDATYNLPAEHYFTFLPTGAAKDKGAMRFADGRGNFLEVYVELPATARVALRKWDGSFFRQQDENGQRWVWQQ